MNTDEQIKEQIKTTFDLLTKVQNKKTIAYVDGLYSLKCGYESLQDFDNAIKYASEIIELINSGSVQYDDKYKQHMSDVLVSCYDTKARQGDFESFCIAMEWNRPIEKQFYLPRARLLKKHGVIQGVQDLIDDKLDLLVLNLPPRIGKSTIGLFLQALLGGMYPDESILAAGHTTGLIDSFYDEIINLITDDEYRYNKIFPNNKIVDKSSEYHFIDLNKKKRFHTYTYISIETGGTGKVQAERLLYCDDLVKDVEQANNPERLEKLYHNYTGTVKDRKIQRLCKDGVYRACPEIHINTPWSLYDVTSRVVANAKSEGNMDRVRIISIPCYDEHGESNFMYDYGKGFDKAYYRDMEVAEDPVIFSAKYLMTPVERDGLVFNRDNVCYYNELPADEPDKVVAYADVTHGGDFYSTLMTQDLLYKRYRCHITSHNAPTNKAKRDRILACQDDIRGIATERNTYRVYFKQPDKIKGNKQYQLAMKNLFGWNQNIAAQNKQHDDFPDSLAGMITNVLGGNKKVGTARSINAEKFGL